MEHRHAEPTQIYQAISKTTGWIGLAVSVTVLAVGAIKHDQLTIQKGFYIAESLAASTAITWALKYSIKRSRPCDANPMIIAAGSHGGSSFPSGHTSEAFSTATSLTIAWPKWYVAVPAFTWAGVVGYSRMYLGVHYPTDVLAGAVVGAGSAWLTWKANKWLQHHNGHPRNNSKP